MSESDKSCNFAGKMNGQSTYEQLLLMQKYRIGLNDCGESDETAARTLGTKRVGGIKHKRCELCSRQPTFNFQAFKGARFCSEHREAGMVNVVNKKCQSAGCMKVTLFFLKWMYCFCTDVHMLAYDKHASTAGCRNLQQLAFRNLKSFVCIIVFVESSCSAQHSTFRLSARVYFAPR